VAKGRFPGEWKNIGREKLEDLTADSYQAKPRGPKVGVLYVLKESPHISNR